MSPKMEFATLECGHRFLIEEIDEILDDGECPICGAEALWAELPGGDYTWAYASDDVDEDEDDEEESGEQEDEDEDFVPVDDEGSESMSLSEDDSSEEDSSNDNA